MVYWLTDPIRAAAKTEGEIRCEPVCGSGRNLVRDCGTGLFDPIFLLVLSFFFFIFFMFLQV